MCKILPPSHPLPGNQAPGVRESRDGTNNIHPAALGLACRGGGGWCREGMQGLMRNRLWGGGPADQHFYGWGLAGIYPHPADPDSSPSLGGVGVSPTRVLCSAAPCGGWQALPWATGAGRHTSHPPPPPTCSAKACGIHGLLGQHFSDIAELWLGAGADWWGGLSPQLRRRPWNEVLPSLPPSPRDS